jgi:transposase
MSLQITEEQISKWPPDTQAEVRLLMAAVAELRREVADLKRRLAKYEGPKTPQNSSLPPCTQHPHAARPTRRKSTRKRGGQPGHRKFERALIPTTDCDETKALKPSACRRCGTRLSGSDSAPLRHQVWELPEIKPHVTEYQRHRLTSPCCSATTCATLPPGVLTGQPGPRLAVDGRSSHVRRLCHLPQPGGDGYWPAPRRGVHRHHPPRPCEDVRAGRSALMVLGASQT